MKNRKILYLDQFAISNMYQAAPISMWGLLRDVIIEKVNKGMLSWPMPLEYLYETVGRSDKDSDGEKNIEYSINFSTARFLLPNNKRRIFLWI